MTQEKKPFERRSEWETSWWELAEKYKRLFEQSAGEDFLVSIARNPSVVHCFRLIYNTLLRSGQIEALESLPEEQRRELWLEAKRLYGLEKQSITDQKLKTYLQDVALALHTLGSYLMVSEN